MRTRGNRTVVFATAAAGWTVLAVAAALGGGLSVGPILLAAAATILAGGFLCRHLERSSAQFERTLTQESAQRLAAVEAERRELEAIVGGMFEGVLVTDSTGRMSFVNSRWRELFGADPDDGSPELRRPPVDEMIARTLETGRPQQEELALSEPVLKTLILKSVPLSETGGCLVVAQDVTEVLRLNEIRRDFVANVSHELKTPLSAIRGFAETLVDGAKNDPEASEKFLERILRQSDRLEALLSDLLTLSRLEHSADEARVEPIDMSRVVRESIELVSERLSEKNLNLEFDEKPVLSMAGDATAVERMCVNLLENAVKYNREGGDIRVRLLAAGSEVVLEVEDSGIGIPENSISRLFERFYRVDKGRSREEGGTGLGLAIVKHAVNLHGGTVEVESELGRGSLFRIRLPAD